MTPPRLARALLALLLPRDHRSVVVADLDDEFSAFAETRGRARAAMWYWRQALGSLPAALTLRLRSHGRHVMGDLIYGGRLLRRNPAMSAAATVTLALGIAATSATVTVSNAVLLRSLPYRDSDRIVVLGEHDRMRPGGGGLSWPDFLDYRDQNRTLDHLAGYNGGSQTLQLPNAPPERVPVTSVTTEFFDALGVRPVRGRGFEEADGKTGAPSVVILMHGCWTLRFGSDPGIVGRPIVLNGATVEVIGVLPETFEFPPRGLTEMWMPLGLSAAQLERRYYHWMDVIGRLKPGVTVEQASSDVDVIGRRFAELDPKFHAGSGARVVPLQEALVQQARPMLLMLTGAAALVLLVACANLACLLLARSQGRAAEMSVRSAIGASRWRLARQMMVENLVLALPGASLGVLAGQWIVRLFVVNLPANQRASLPHLQQLGVDLPTVALSVAIVVGAVLGFGLVPALRTSRAATRLPSRGAAGVGRRDLWLQGAFIASQAALALVLLFGAGLMGQSVRRLIDVSPGFETSRLLTATLSMSGERYRDRETVAAFHAQALETIGALPGVTGAASIDQLPLTGRGNTGVFRIAGDPSGRENLTLVRIVSPNYFDAIGVPLLSGRTFQSGDRSGAPPVVVVNQALATTVLGRDAIGQRVTFPFMPAPLEIVGVVGDEQFASIDQPFRPVVYFAYGQGPVNDMDLVIRTAGEPGALVAPLRAAVARLDPGLPVYRVLAMDEIMGRSDAVFRRRMVLVLMGGFAVSALVLAAVGLYGVLAQIVAHRTREIGIRLALGAGAPNVAAAVLRPGFAALACGTVVGVLGCLAAGRLLEGLLFQTRSTDLSALALVVFVLALAACAASVTPVRRALHVDPAQSLHE